MDAVEVITETKELTAEDKIVAMLKAKYRRIQDTIDAAEEREIKASSGLNAHKAREHIARHEVELLKARVEKARNELNTKKNELAETQKELAEAKEEIQENADFHKEFKETDNERVDKIEEVEDKCAEAKEMLFEVHRKFHEATRFLAMKECDGEAKVNRLNVALQRIAEVEDMRKETGQQMAQVEKRGGKTAERKLEKEAKIEELTKQIESIDDVTEEALKSISKLQLKREYRSEESEYWDAKTERVEEEINSANQGDWGAL